MSCKDREPTLAEENEKFRQALISLAADMYVNSCGHDTRTKRRALDFAEDLGTEEEMSQAVERIRQKALTSEELRKG